VSFDFDPAFAIQNVKWVIANVETYMLEGSFPGRGQTVDSGSMPLTGPPGLGPQLNILISEFPAIICDSKERVHRIEAITTEESAQNAYQGSVEKLWGQGVSLCGGRFRTCCHLHSSATRLSISSKLSTYILLLLDSPQRLAIFIKSSLQRLLRI